MTKDWVHGVGYSHACRSCCRLSEEQRLLLLHLLEPVLLGYCQHQLTALSSIVILHPPLLCEGWGSRPLCLTGDSSVLKDLRWSCACTAHSSILSSVQYLSFFCKTFFWAILDSSSFSLFTVVQFFTSWYAFLLDPQIFLNLTTVFSYPVFFRRLLMSLFIFLCSQDLPGSNLFFLSSLFLRNKTLKKKNVFTK